MRRAALLLGCALALTGPVAGDVAVGATIKPKAKKSCRWVKRHGRRTKVCTARKGKTTKKTTTSTNTSAPAPALTPPSLAPGTPSDTTGSAPADGFTVTSAAPDATSPAPAVAPPARLQVTSREFTLTISRASVPAGALIAELVNRGEDPHDLHVRPAAGGADVLALPETASGDVVDSDATTLAAGTYTLYCSLPGHEQAGMRATLTVK
jgi:plastocyanin